MYGVIEQHPDFKEYASPQIPLNVTLSPPKKRKAPAKEVTVDEEPPTVYFDDNEDDGKQQCPCCQKWYIKSHNCQVSRLTGVGRTVYHLSGLDLYLVRRTSNGIADFVVLRKIGDEYHKSTREKDRSVPGETDHHVQAAQAEEANTLLPIAASGFQNTLFERDPAQAQSLLEDIQSGHIKLFKFPANDQNSTTVFALLAPAQSPQFPHYQPHGIIRLIAQKNRYGSLVVTCACGWRCCQHRTCLYALGHGHFPVAHSTKSQYDGFLEFRVRREFHQLPLVPLPPTLINKTNNHLLPVFACCPVCDGGLKHSPAQVTQFPSANGIMSIQGTLSVDIAVCIDCRLPLYWHDPSSGFLLNHNALAPTELLDQLMRKVFNQRMPFTAVIELFMGDLRALHSKAKGVVPFPTTTIDSKKLLGLLRLYISLVKLPSGLQTVCAKHGRTPPLGISDGLWKLRTVIPALPPAPSSLSPRVASVAQSSNNPFPDTSIRAQLDLGNTESNMFQSTDVSQLLSGFGMAQPGLLSDEVPPAPSYGLSSQWISDSLSSGVAVCTEAHKSSNTELSVEDLSKLIKRADMGDEALDIHPSILPEALKDPRRKKAITLALDMPITSSKADIRSRLSLLDGKDVSPSEVKTCGYYMAYCPCGVPLCAKSMLRSEGVGDAIDMQLSFKSPFSVLVTDQSDQVMCHGKRRNAIFYEDTPAFHLDGHAVEESVILAARDAGKAVSVLEHGFDISSYPANPFLTGHPVTGKTDTLVISDYKHHTTHITNAKKKAKAADSDNAEEVRHLALRDPSSYEGIGGHHNLARGESGHRIFEDHHIPRFEYWAGSFMVNTIAIVKACELRDDVGLKAQKAVDDNNRRNPFALQKVTTDAFGRIIISPRESSVPADRFLPIWKQSPSMNACQCCNDPLTKTPNVLICGHLICHDCYQLGRPCTLCIDPTLLLINFRSCSGSCQLNWVHNGLSGVITPTDGLIFTQGNTDYTLVYLSEDQVWMVEWDTKRALLFRNTPRQCGCLQLTLKSDLPLPATKNT